MCHFSNVYTRVLHFISIKDIKAISCTPWALLTATYYIVLHEKAGSAERHDAEAGPEQSDCRVLL